MKVRVDIKIDAVCCLQEIKEQKTPLLDAPTSENGETRLRQGGGKTVDEILTHIGMGRFQAFMLFVLGVAYMGDAGEALLLSFLGPDVKCEWGITSIEESCITAAVFLGMASGAVTFGHLGDRIGRRPTVAIDVTMTALFGMLSAAAPNVWFLIFCRFAVGAGLGGFPLLMSMFSEFLPKNQRGTALSSFQLFWGAGALATAGVAWIVMPHYHWRGLTLTAALPLVLLLVLLPFVPESPRYLVVQGRQEEALAVLHKIARFNGTSIPGGTELKAVSEVQTATGDCCSFREQFMKLFKPPLHKVTAILWPNWIAVVIGYYSIVMLTTSIQANADGALSCIDGHVHFSNEDFRDIMIDACAEIPGILFAVFTVEYFGRRRMLLFTWLGSSLSMLLLPTTSSLHTAFLFSGRFFVQASFAVLMVLVPELYPSSCRSLAMGAGCLVSRAGGAVSPFLAQAAYNTYGLTFVALLQGILFLFLCGLTFFVPAETTGKAMKETINEIEQDFNQQTLHNSSSSQGTFFTRPEIEP